MNDRFNTIAGWVLFAGIVALGSSIVVGESFHHGRPDVMGYPIPGVVLEGEGEAEAEKPIAFYLATADAAKGEQAFKKCAACHNIDPGGANALGPGLYGVMGNAMASHPGFAFSDALKSKGGTWGWDEMSAWVKSPRAFAPGTKMTFAGISDPQERANLLLFMNSRDPAPLPVPPPPAEEAPAEETAPEGEAAAGNEAAPDANEADANAAAPETNAS